MSIRTPPEQIASTDHLVSAFNRDKLGASMVWRIVTLACGHSALTRNAKKMVCPRCTEMLCRSVATGEEDYETFRHGNGIDRMKWSDDPCRNLNERVRE